MLLAFRHLSYSPARFVSVAKDAISGNPDLDRAGTSHVERKNGTLRQWCKRLISFDEIKKRAAPDMGPLGKDESDGDPVEQGDSQLVLFEGITVRKIFHQNEWHFSVVDIIAALTGSERPAKYWSDLKSKLVQDEGFSELSDKIGQLKMQAADGKFYLTDSVTVETALRIIQSIPSHKAEPFRRWLAKVVADWVAGVEAGVELESVATAGSAPSGSGALVNV
jgi:hypothetical protein